MGRERIDASGHARLTLTMAQNQVTPPAALSVPVDPALLTQLGTALAALAAALIAGWTALVPRFKRLNTLRKESGRFGGWLVAMYRLPQWLNVVLIVGFGGILLMSVIATLETGGMLKVQPTLSPTGASLFAQIKSLPSWILLIVALLLGLVIHFDVFARISVWATRILSLGYLGPNGESVAWHQANELVRGQGEAQLLWLNGNGVERVASAALRKMVEEPLQGGNRAARPAGLNASERANLLLFGCIIEQLYTNQGEGNKWQWQQLYAALAEAHRKAQLFTPQNINALDPSKSFGQLIRTHTQPYFVANGATAALTVDIDADVDAAFVILREKFGGDATRLGAGLKRRIFGVVKAAYWDVAKFPRMGDDTMRPQFIKLCIRWDIFKDVSPSLFVQPFSSTIAWYLLNNSAIGVASDQKLVTFNGPQDRPLARIAAGAAIERALTQIRDGKADEMASIRARYKGEPAATQEWMIRQEIDTTLFLLAREEERRGKEKEWKGEWRWKVDDRVASRV